MPSPIPKRALTATARATAGAVIFAFPLLMTMEMWAIGQYVDRVRLLTFLFASLPMLIGLSHFVGFEETFEWREDLIDTLVAIAVGSSVSAVLLALFGLLSLEMPANEIAGKVALQTVPASIGALLARKQLGSDDAQSERRKLETSLAGTMFLMAVGALFLAFNVAPTEEMILIAYKMGPLQALALMALSIGMLHAFVYAIGFYGEERHEFSPWVTFYRVTVSGYAIALLVSLFVLWVFGRTDDRSIAQMVMPTVVLGFPAALGAATARLIL